MFAFPPIVISGTADKIVVKMCLDWFFVERQQTVITTYPKINEQ